MYLFMTIVPMRTVQHSLELEYVTHLKELSTIRVKLKTQEVIKLCKKLKNQDDFIFALQDHLFSITKINISALTLNELTTTNLGIRRDGKFKVYIKKKDEYISCVLIMCIDVWSYFKNGRCQDH